MSSKSTSAKTLTVRDISSNRKGKDDRGRSKSRLDFRYLKKNQCAFYNELEHWKVDCPRIKIRSKRPRQISHR